jgi:DNA helicase-2/ATP-dependent DNA helicase PcrA
MMTTTDLSILNSEQRRAVEYMDGPLLILAGAGSGKTRVLTYKIAYMLERRLVQPWEILAVTFTNKAAGEMRNRVTELVGVGTEGMWIGTFHSLCARMLRIESRLLGYDTNFTIYDVDDQVRLLKQVMESLNVNQSILKPRAVQYRISDCKNKLIDPQQFETKAADFTDRQIAKVYREYEKALRRHNALDFDDLLLKPLDLFTKHPEVLQKYQNKFRYILVDEYQDTNKAQYYFIKKLSETHRRICVVGDEDQSIYRWRGADIENILSFERDYPDCQVVRLEQNYRSTQIILDAANAVVQHNSKRLGKNLWSEKTGGAEVQVIETADEGLEALNIVNLIKQMYREHNLDYRDMAILYRTNAQSRALEDKLRRANIPYVIVGGTKFYDRKEVKDVLAYLRVLVNPQDNIALERIINFPTRGIGGKSLERLRTYAQEHQLSLYDAISAADQIDSLPAGTADKVSSFARQLASLRNRLEEVSAYELAQEVINTFGLVRMYELSVLPDDQVRLENINELLNSIADFSENAPDNANHLAKYLEDVALLTDIDRWDSSNSAVTLMTLHSAKGLEFPMVVIAGMEDGLFPLFRSLENDEALEEERRLFYVGMTRAKDFLFLTWARQRRRFSSNAPGNSFRNMASRFLDEIPVEFLKTRSSYGTREGVDNSRYNRRRSFDDSQAPAFAAEMITDEGGWKIGDWVLHDQYGKGQILGIESANMGTKLSVFFKSAGMKKLIVEYANLQKIDA